MTIDKIQAAKFVINALAGMGATTISKQIIDNNVEPANLIQKISVPIASLAIGTMTAGAVKEHTNARVDSFIERLAKLKEQSTDTTPEAAE